MTNDLFLLANGLIVKRVIRDNSGRKGYFDIDIDTCFIVQEDKEIEYQGNNGIIKKQIKEGTEYVESLACGPLGESIRFNIIAQIIEYEIGEECPIDLLDQNITDCKTIGNKIRITVKI